MFSLKIEAHENKINDTPLLCDFCDFQCFNRAALGNHCRKHHSEKFPKKKAKKKDTGGVVSSFKDFALAWMFMINNFFSENCRSRDLKSENWFCKKGKKIQLGRRKELRNHWELINRQSVTFSNATRRSYLSIKLRVLEEKGAQSTKSSTKASRDRF